MRTNLHLALTATAVALCLGCISHDAGLAGKALPRIFADGVQMEHLQARLAELDSSAKNIIAFAESEKRSLNGDEVKELDKIYAAFEEVDAEIKVRERAANMSARAAGGGGRQTNPDLTPTQVAAAAASDAVPAATQQSPALARRVAASARAADTGKWGFRSPGEFIVAVFRASARGASPDPRLIANAPTTFGQEGVGADGGFAVPPDFRATIIKKVAGEESLLSMTDQQTTSSNTITLSLIHISEPTRRS